MVSWEEPVIRPAASARGFVIGLAQLDAFTLTTIFERCAHVMRVVPHVMRAAFSSAIRVACEEIVDGFSVDNIIRQERAWKLLLLLPRMLLCRPAEEAVFQEGIGAEIGVFLARVGLVQHTHGSQRSVRRGRHHNSDAVEARAVRAVKLVQLGEVSAGRQALESARVALGTLATLAELTNQQRWPPLPRDPLPADLANAMPESPFDLAFDRFANNIRSAKRG